jgi:hypothetical protein
MRRYPLVNDVSATGKGELANALAFVDQLGRFDVAELEVIGRTWRTIVAADPPAWFAAEGSVGQAVRTTGRQLMQESLLEELSEVVRRRGWWRLDRIESAEGQGLTEAGVQYAATLATIALLVRDVVTSLDFELIYSPFVPVVPVPETGERPHRDVETTTRRDAARGYPPPPTLGDPQ